jgi:hypothetical protein
MAHNVSHVGDVAPSLTEARGHVAERRAAAPRSPRRPVGAAMHIRAVMRSCAVLFDLILLQHWTEVTIEMSKTCHGEEIDNVYRLQYIPF